MIRKLIMAVLVVSFLSATTFAFAEDVFITPKGKKYHTETCRRIKNRETQKIDKEEAIKNGYEPCKICHKEDVVVKESKDKKEK